MAKCAVCGNAIQNIYKLNGKIYGYNCYQKELALIYKKYEDEKNEEYSAKCFAAMQIFKNKKSNRFHDSVCEQYENCKKITAKQLECVLRSFTKNEMLDFYILYFSLTKKGKSKRDIAYSVYNNIKDKRYNNICDETIMNREDIANILFYVDKFRHGFFFCKDLIVNRVFIEETGSERLRHSTLKSYQEDDEFEVLKIVYPSEIVYVF